MAIVFILHRVQKYNHPTFDYAIVGKQYVQIYLYQCKPNFCVKIPTAHRPENELTNSPYQVEDNLIWYDIVEKLRKTKENRF